MFNQLLKEAGEFGLYQKCLTFGGLLLNMGKVCLLNWIQIFILMVAPHRCKTGVNDTLYSNSEVTPATGECYLRMPVNDSEQNIYSNASGEVLFETGICPFGWVYDFSQMHNTFSTEQDMVCDNAWKMYAIHVSFYSGAIIGGIVAGWIADKYGRKRAYQACLLLSIVSDISTVFAPDFVSFAVARFFSSLGGSNLSTLIFVLTMEYTGPKYRLLNLAVWCLTFTAVSTVMPWIAHLFSQWRHILAIAFVPYSISLVMSCFLPESASWLLTKGRLDETADLIHSVAKVNGKDLSLERIKRELEKEKQEISKVEVLVKTRRSTLDLCRTPRIRRTTVLLSLLWMIASACYVGNNLESSNLPYPWYLSYSIGGISELPANVICLFLLDRIGRRWTNVFFFVLGGSLAIVVGRALRDRTVVMVVSMIVRLCYAAAFDITFTFSSELFPTEIRGRGILLIRSIGGIANALSPFVVYLSETDKLLPLVVLGAFSVLGGILNLFLPETAQQHLPHTIEEGEEFGKDQPFCFCPFAHIKDRKASHVVTGEDNKALEDANV